MPLLPSEKKKISPAPEATEPEAGKESSWIGKTIDVECLRGFDKVKALVLGYVGIHEQVRGTKGFWAVTSTTTGRGLAMVRNRQEAEKVGELLWSKCCLALRRKTVEEILEALPAWAHEWLKECSAQKEFVSPSIPKG